MSFIEELQKRINQKTGLLGTWLPTDRIRVGDFGLIDKGRLLIEGHLSDVQVDFEELIFDSRHSKIDFSNNATFSTQSSTESEINDKNIAKIEISLNSKGAFVYQLSGVKERKFTNKPEVYRQIVSLILSRKIRWLDQFVLVDEVRAAQSATIFVSESDTAGLRIGGELGDLTEGSAPLASIKGRFTIQVSKGSVFQAICAKSTTPLYGMRRFSFDDGIEPDSKGTLRMLADWFSGKFGRPYVDPKEISVREFLSSDNLEQMTFEDTVSGAVFTLNAHRLIDDFLNPPPSPSGGSGPAKRIFELEQERSISRMATGLVKRRNFGAK